MTYKVLIVEDDPMVAMINEQYVKKNNNFTICGICKSGQDAIDFFKTKNADLVILDVYMPIMDGVETLKKIREQKIKTEVIMVTAANDTQTIESTMHLGVIDYLIKPFAYERFQVALEKFALKFNALNNTNVLDQSSIDNILLQPQKNSEKSQQKINDFPKGIQKRTLLKIENYLKEKTGFVNGDLIAEEVGLSIVTVRHYMTYLVKSGVVTESVNYETGGRPSVLYKKV